MVKTLEQAFKKLDAGRSDLVIEERFAGLQMLNQLGFKGIQLLEPPLKHYPLYHYIHTRHAALVPQLEETLQQMEQEGVIRTLQEQVMQELFNTK